MQTQCVRILARTSMSARVQKATVATAVSACPSTPARLTWATAHLALRAVCMTALERCVCVCSNTVTHSSEQLKYTDCFDYGLPSTQSCCFPQAHCECLEGFEKFVEGKGCTIKDMCKPDSCHKYATCATVEPGTVE